MSATFKLDIVLSHAGFTQKLALGDQQLATDYKFRKDGGQIVDAVQIAGDDLTKEGLIHPDLQDALDELHSDLAALAEIAAAVTSE